MQLNAIHHTPKAGRIKALGLTSGGLDSTLAALVMKRLGIEVLQICFTTPFFSDENARRMAAQAGLDLESVDITNAHMRMLRSPKYGYGRHMNPCIDCHTLMVRLAGELLAEKKADFVFTGEVLGQRPMSQNRQSLAAVNRGSGLNGLLVRPLSGRLLDPTAAELKGWIDREQLLEFQGRSRKPQMRLAEELNLKWYPAPAGGCLLTQEVFARRLKDLFHYQGEDVDTSEIELLKLGRHLRFNDRVKVVVGRNESENDRMLALRLPQSVVLGTVDIPGPLVVAFRGLDQELFGKAADLCATYSDASRTEAVRVEVRIGSTSQWIQGTRGDRDSYGEFLI
ncbi:MAG: tRNA 4-thiouridine(8) synthase ThiI [Deltaproteobacteria bacterium]|nr:tRNA 4-thiouridine(8) synthase ThiI [Deltaproteobacteria bacterium]